MSRRTLVVVQVGNAAHRSKAFLTLRSLRHLVNALAELEARGITFISLRDNLDLCTPAGRLMFNVIEAMAQFERDLIAERVKAGMARARLDGKRIGRKRRDDVDGVRVAELREQGRSWAEIARELKAGVGTVCRAYQRASEKVPETTPTTG